MTVAIFVPADWRAAFPEFTAVTDGAANFYFSQATALLDNTDCSPVPCDPTTYQPRLGLLWLLTSHIASIFGAAGTAGGSGIVGRIDSATEGTVSVHAALEGDIASRAFYGQTPYGLLYWTATASYRSAIYVPGEPICGPFEGFGGVPYYWGRG